MAADLLCRTCKQFDGTAGDVEVLKQYSVPYEMLDMDGCVRHEPALQAVREKFVGGVLLAGDEICDCFLFTRRLARLAEGLGVSFRQGVRIHAIEHPVVA